MTEREFQVIRTELQRLGTGLSKAIDQIVAQEAEINAFQAILERKKLVSPQELELARNQAARELNEMLQSPDSNDEAAPPASRNGSNIVNMGRFRARRCKTRF